MTDALAIGGLVQSFKTLTDIGKALLGLRDAALIREKVIELNREILSAQASALATQTDQFTLLEQKRTLEKEVADLKAWDAEKQKYELVNVRPQNAPGGNAFAYALKKEASSTEPPHFICEHCYQDGRKSTLQEEVRYPGATNVLFCPRCGLELSRTGVWNSITPRYGAPTLPSRRR